MEFKRNIESYGLTDEVKKTVIVFLEGNEDIVAIPGKECLWLYYDGKPFANIKAGKWNKFSKSYNEDVKKILLRNNNIITDLEINDFFKNEDIDKKEFYLKKELLDVFKKVFKTKFKDQIERIRQQEIVWRHQSFDSDKFSICGMETTIPEKDLERTTRVGKQVEIDMVAICPAKHEILLIEYKCTQAATTRDITKSLKTWNVKDKVNKNLAEHFKDYLAIMEACKNEYFVSEIIKAYNCLASLYGKDTRIKLEDTEKYVKNMKIVFLFTDRKDDKSTKDELTPRLYANVKKYITDFEKNYINRLKEVYNDNCDEKVKNINNTLYYRVKCPKEVDLNDESKFVKRDNL